MVLIQLLLPTTSVHPDGPQRTAAALNETGRELAGRFEGLTAYVRSPAKGVWTAPDGHTEHDDVVMVEIVTPSFDRAWWRTYAKSLAKRFQQDAIHVRAVSIEMVDDNAT